jgi:heat shock protein HtpX
MAVSRSREYLADATGAGFSGNPEGLARALEKLGAYAKQLPMQAAPATAHMMIVNPLTGGGLTSLFSTHPPLTERIARLRGVGAPRGGRPESTGGRSSGQAAGRDMWDRLSR